MIVITGATGSLNGATLHHLLDHIPAGEVAVVTRDPSRAQHIADRGVQVRHGDYADPAGLPTAFAGADQLLLVSSNDMTADHVALHRNAVEAAVEAGAGRVLYTSHQGASNRTPFLPGRTHAATEDLLAGSDLPWTSLRNGFYTHSITWLMGPWRGTGMVRVPHDGPVSWTTREDAAEAAAAVLLSPGRYDGPVTLTAPNAPTFADLAQIASEVAGRPVAFDVVEPDAWMQEIDAGQAQGRASFMLGMYEAAEQGFFAGTDPLLGELLQRDPTSVREVLAAAD